jgi:2-oxoisovalerate dehydrogenase E1 component alpha subunit
VLTYRVGHHSTSDDSTKYRRKEEIEHWHTKKYPVTRFQTWIQAKGWWSAEEEEKLRKDIRTEVGHHAILHI